MGSGEVFVKEAASGLRTLSGQAETSPVCPREAKLDWIDIALVLLDHYIDIVTFVLYNRASSDVKACMRNVLGIIVS